VVVSKLLRSRKRPWLLALPFMLAIAFLAVRLLAAPHLRPRLGTPTGPTRATLGGTTRAPSPAAPDASSASATPSAPDASADAAGGALPVSPEASSPAAPTTATTTTTTPRPVMLGLYLHHIPELDLKTNSYIADFYLWFLWTGDEDPTTSFEFTNVVGPGELSSVPTYTDAEGKSKPEDLADGKHYQAFHVQGHFTSPFDVHAYPFDEQSVEIAIESTRYNVSKQVYVADLKDSGVHPDLLIPGYLFRGWQMKISESRFATLFGDPRAKAGETYSHVEFSMTLARPVKGLLAKVILPLFIIIFITFGAGFCAPSDLDARLSITITALISAVALQYVTATDLPPTMYLVLPDKMYVLSYFVILIGTFVAIYVKRLDTAGQTAWAHRFDRYALVGLIATFLGGSTAILMFR
jgi:hypothetical protein